MKKDQIILIRILSVCALIVIMLLLLIFGAGNGLFQNIVNNINHNIVDAQSGAASIYNLYYYKGLDVIYMILFSIAVFSSGIAIISILTRYNAAYFAANISAISMLVTGLFLILARVCEYSEFMHRFIAGFYIDQVSESIETARLMKKIPLSGIFLVVFSILCLMLIRSSRMKTIKVYHEDNKVKQLGIYIPVLFSAVFIEYLREVLISVRCSQVGNDMNQVHTFLQDYYFANEWGFNWNYAWYLIIISVILIYFRDKIKKQVHIGLLITTAIPCVLLSVRSIIYSMNPPDLFGFLTFDEHVCDLTETAFVMYLIRFVLDILLLTNVLDVLIIRREGYKKILISYGINVVISILGILILGNLFGISGMYIACMIANVITLVCNFYFFNISRSHH